MKLTSRIVLSVALAAVVAVAIGCTKTDKNPTSPGGDNVAPTVSSTTPTNGATGGVGAITATFSEDMSASSLVASTFTLAGPGATPVYGTVTYNAATDRAQFIPNAALQPSTQYTATLSTGIRDAAGNALASTYSWSFTTAAATSAPASPTLGAAGSFVVLGGSTVTSTGATALTGDLGVSPGTAVTGFPPGTLTGTVHAGDVTSAAAMAALTTAYNDLAGRTLAPITVAGNLGGMTLPPGLYKSTSSLAISSGDLTLDARGDANAVFIFQMASTLTTTAGRSVILAGGAKASHVFWQVGSSATLGTTSSFKGTILADQSITLATGATLNGRALARIGAVALSGNAIVLPTP